MERTERPTDSGPGASLPPTLIYIAGFLFGWWLETHTPLYPDWRPRPAVVFAGWGLAGAGVFLRLGPGDLLEEPDRDHVP